MRSRFDYQYLAVRIEPDGRGGFRARVEQPSGGGKAPFVPPWTGEELDALLRGLEQQVRGGEEEAGAAPARDLVAATGPLVPNAREVGERLFRALFRDGLERTLVEALAEIEQSSTRALRLRLILDLTAPGMAPIAALPWELLYDPYRHRFLAQYLATSLVRFLDAQPAAAPPRERLPLRILIVPASPRDLPPLDLDREVEGIERAFRGRGDVAVEVLRRAGLGDLRRRLRDQSFHVLHFLGHGKFDGDSGEGRLIFEGPDGEPHLVPAELLATTLRGIRSLRLVVLAACDSGRHLRREGLDPYRGVAAALVREGLPAVVAMQFPLSDAAAITWSGAFYFALAAGDPVDAAMVEGRQAILRGRPGSLEWAIPALFLRAVDGQLFDLEPEAAPGLPAPRAARPPGRAVRFLRSGWWAPALALLLLVGAIWLTDLAGPAPPQGATANPPACPSPPGLDMAFVEIRPSSFRMGSDKGDPEGDSNELPAHQVSIGEPFCLGTFEVTVEQWERVMGSSEEDGGEGAGRLDLPAAGISWEDAQRFVGRLARRDPQGGYRLPTEAEWEYAARAGTTTAWSFGDDPADLHRYGNCRADLEGPGDGFEGLAPVGSFRPNPWGLYDLYGNVSEWVADEYALYPGSPADAPPEGRRLRRGGSFDNSPQSCRSASRSDVVPDRRFHDSGLRLVRAVLPAPQPAARSVGSRAAQGARGQPQP